MTSRDVTRAMRYQPLTKPFRTAYQYCNLMYITVGHVVESISGQFIGDFLFDHVFEPLKMTSTYYRLSDTLSSGKPFAKGYYWQDSKKAFRQMDYVDESGMEGAGGCFSTVNDYAKWVHMMAHRVEPISAPSHEALVKPRTITGKSSLSDGVTTYGFGWSMEPYHGYEIISHDGGINGVSSFVYSF